MIRYLNQIVLIINKNYKFIELQFSTGFPQDHFDGIYCQRDYYINLLYHSYSYTCY